MQITMNLKEYDREYDTDEVSITSTVPADEAEDEYDVECIFSEGQDPDGNGTRYLIKWVGYPLHECTWEPLEHFAGTTDLLDHWNAQKLEMGEDAFYKMVVDHYDMFEESKDKAAEAKAKRHTKRMKKRRKLAQARKIPSDDDDDDLPLLLSRRRTLQSKGEGSNAKGKQRRRLSSNRRGPLDVSPSSSEAPSDADSATTEDSLLEEITSKQKRRKTGKERQNRPAELATPSEQDNQNGPTVSNAREHAEKENLSKAPNNANSSINARNKSSIAKKVLTSGPSNSVPVAKTIRSNNVNAAKVPRPIKMINQPKPRPREWKSDKLYTTLQSQNKGRKHFQAEGTPDPSSLEFVNGTPTGRPPPRAPQTSTADNPFGRRESGLRRVVEDLSPPPSPKRPLQSFEIGKIPLICYDYRNGNNCRFTAQNCRFMHRDASPSGRMYKVSDWNGRVPGKYADPPLTCYFWLRGKHGCSASAEDCDFAHENTGLLANTGYGNSRPEPIDKNEVPLRDRPGAGAFIDSYAIHIKNTLTCLFWLRGQYGCTKSANICKFAHWNTGRLPDKEGRQPIDIDPNEPPSSANLSDMTCFFWNQWKCRNGSDRCRSRHEYTGQIANPPLSWKPPVGYKHPPVRYDEHRTADQFTCYLWTKGYCPKTAESCHFTHGWLPDVAVPPLGFVEPPAIQQQNVQPRLSHPPPQHKTESSVQQESTHDAQVTTNIDVTMGNTDQPETVAPPPAPPVLSLQTNLEQSPEYISTLKLKEWTEEICKLDCKDMFVYNGDNDRDATLDKRAFLIFHPKDHVEELETLTRWLLIHHVEVYNFWSDGSWTAFRKEIARGGSGIIIAHPEFELFAEIPDFFQILAAKVRIWSIGHQAGFEFDTSVPSVFPPHLIEYRYDRIEIFPHGGIIFITDDVFNHKPQQALTLIKHFLAKIEACRAVDGPADPWRRVDDGFLPWRLGVRPELMQYLYDTVITHEKAIDAGDLTHKPRLDLYELLEASRYIEQDTDSINSPHDLPVDYFPIISKRRDGIQVSETFFKALKLSQNAANTVMVEHFSSMVIEQRQSYRKFFVVHTQPDSVAARDWKKRIGILDEVLTPERCIEELEKDPKGNRFDFFEWAFEKKADGGQGGCEEG
ncbi:hypothetical protein DM02DRAFT_692527 [Periconia macrospinosa]|uniref:Chromo domain-containing protein n=1 Tax=Periconia macrospinosa TaxID=97972 RepID=A0A2V1DB08_9PLEO|nr:hypothetical protein DM02DRAFT_692527 [Periconia macrospinosa]